MALPTVTKEKDMELLEKKCIPCSIGEDPLTTEQIQENMKQLEEGWEVIEDKKIKRQFKFKDFKSALDFVVKIGDIAESEGHHPDLCLGWGKVEVEFMTHKIQGLHENDFIMAAKTDKNHREL